MKYKYYKRFLDIFFSIILMLIFFPLLLFISISIKFDSPGKILFRQFRVGEHGRKFKIYKFRTMVFGAEYMNSGVFTDSADPRITKVGHILRRTSFDELPQIINIFLGDMSFIGPRPVPLVTLDNYDHSDTRRLAVKPGITGWAQVNGRNSLTWPEKIEKDLYYIQNISLKLDIKIFFMTIMSILTGKGIYSGRYRKMVENNSK